MPLYLRPTVLLCCWWSEVDFVPVVCPASPSWTLVMMSRLFQKEQAILWKCKILLAFPSPWCYWVLLDLFPFLVLPQALWILQTSQIYREIESYCVSSRNLLGWNSFNSVAKPTDKKDQNFSQDIEDPVRICLC